MADWNASNITLTAKGSSALSRVEAGDGSLTITRVVASEQYVQESTLREVTTLSVENLELTIIDRHEVEDGGSVIQAQLSNLNLTKKFTLNEIGVFATHSSDPDNEFLYIIAQVDLNTGDEIPLYSVTPVTATYDIYLYNVGADKVNVTISSAGLVTYEALNAICGLVKRSNAYELGQIANHASLPTGMYLECVAAGTTASTPIPIPTSPKEGDMVKDGSVTWVLSKTLSSRKLGYRQPSKAYTVGNIVYHSALPTGWCLKCTTAGTTSASDITPSSTVGGTITDGGVTWTVVKYALTSDVPPLASALATPRTISLTGKATGSTTFDGSANAAINVTSVNADTATKLSTARKINITGNVTGSADFDGSKDIQIATSLANVSALAHRLLSKTTAADMRGVIEANAQNCGGIVAESLTDQGYVKFANGLLIEWGTVNVDHAPGTDGIGTAYHKWWPFPIKMSVTLGALATDTTGNMPDPQPFCTWAWSNLYSVCVNCQIANRIAFVLAIGIA